MPNCTVEVGMASVLYNPVEIRMVIVQMELVIWLRRQATITHPVPCTRKLVHIHSGKKLCLEENNSSANNFRYSWKNRGMVSAKIFFPKLRISNTALPVEVCQHDWNWGEVTTDFQRIWMKPSSLSWSK